METREVEEGMITRLPPLAGLQFVNWLRTRVSFWPIYDSICDDESASWRQLDDPCLISSSRWRRRCRTGYLSLNPLAVSYEPVRRLRAFLRTLFSLFHIFSARNVFKILSQDNLHINENFRSPYDGLWNWSNHGTKHLVFLYQTVFGSSSFPGTIVLVVVHGLKLLRLTCHSVIVFLASEPEVLKLGNIYRSQSESDLFLGCTNIWFNHSYELFLSAFK